MFVVFPPRSASRVPQATLVLSLYILPSLLPGANAAPSTPDLDPSATTALQLNDRAEPTSASSSSSSSSLSVPALLAIVAVTIFLLLLGATLAYMYARRWRVRQKRADHRKRAAQFQEMHRAGARPYYAAGSSAPISVSLPVPAAVVTADEKKGERVVGPRYPIKAYVV